MTENDGRRIIIIQSRISRPPVPARVFLLRVSRRCNVSPWDARCGSHAFMLGEIGASCSLRPSGTPIAHRSSPSATPPPPPPPPTPPPPRPPPPPPPESFQAHAQAPCPHLIAELPHLSGSPAGPTANPPQPRPNSPQFNQFNACGPAGAFKFCRAARRRRHRLSTVNPFRRQSSRHHPRPSVAAAVPLPPRRLACALRRPSRLARVPAPENPRQGPLLCLSLASTSRPPKSRRPPWPPALDARHRGSSTSYYRCHGCTR